MRRQRRWGVEIIAMLIMSKIIIVVNAALLGCSLEAGEGLGRLPTRGPEGGRGVLSWGGGSYVASPPQKNNFMSGTWQSQRSPGQEPRWILYCRCGSFFPFSFSWPTVVGVAECGFSKLLGAGCVCLPTAFPPPRPPVPRLLPLLLPSGR